MSNSKVAEVNFKFLSATTVLSIETGT